VRQERKQELQLQEPMPVQQEQLPELQAQEPMLPEEWWSQEPELLLSCCKRSGQQRTGMRSAEFLS
jgi:hypothetical protein